MLYVFFFLLRTQKHSSQNKKITIYVHLLIIFLKTFHSILFIWKMFWKGKLCAQASKKTGIVNFVNCILCVGECVCVCAIERRKFIQRMWTLLYILKRCTMRATQAINIKWLNILMVVLKVIFVDGKSHIWCKVIDVSHFFLCLSLFSVPLRWKLMHARFYVNHIQFI